MSLARQAKEFDQAYKNESGDHEKLVLEHPAREAGNGFSPTLFEKIKNAIELADYKKSLAQTLSSPTKFQEIVIDLSDQVYYTTVERDHSSRLAPTAESGRYKLYHKYTTTKTRHYHSIEDILDVVTDSTKFKAKKITLNLGRNKLCWDSMKSIFDKIKSNTRHGNLHHKIELQLNNNNLDDEDAIAISKFIASGYCPNGLRLVLTNNYFTQASLALFSNAFNDPKCPKDIEVMFGNCNLKEGLQHYLATKPIDLSIMSGKAFSAIFSQKPVKNTALSFRPYEEDDLKILIKTLENQTTEYSSININLDKTRYESFFHFYYKDLINALSQNKSSKLEINLSLRDISIEKKEMHEMLTALMQQRSPHTINVSLAKNSLQDKDLAVISEHIRRGKYPANLSLELGENYISKELLNKINDTAAKKLTPNMFEFFKAWDYVRPNKAEKTYSHEFSSEIVYRGGGFK